MNTEILIPQKINSSLELSKIQNIRTDLKGKLKIITDEQNKVIKPLLEATRAERARFAPTIAKYEEAIKKISDVLSAYQTEQLRAQREKEEKILSDGRLKTETVITRLAEVEQPVTKGFRKHQVLKVTNISTIPLEYFDLNESKLLADLKAGKIVQGAEIDVKMIAVG